MRFFNANGKFGGHMMYNFAWIAIMTLSFLQHQWDEVRNNNTKLATANKNELVQNPPPVALNCLNNTNISISETGSTTLNPGYFVSPSYPNFPFLILTIEGRSNTVITCDDVGHTLTAVVLDPIANVTCSSQFNVEDKLAPVFVCQTLELPCGIDVYSVPQPYTPLVTVTDNCTNPPVVTILSHQEKIYNCPSPYTFEIVRQYKATDASGNSSTCTDTVRFLRPVLADIVFPKDTSINCNVFNSDTSITGQPTWLGYPLTGVCYTWFSFTDQVIPTGCAGKFSIRRTWMVSDECTGTIRNHVQCIQSIDTLGPVLVCPDNEVVPTNTGSCFATYTFHGANATDNCSSTINYQYKVNGIYVHSSSVQLNIGTHTIEVLADDGCYNTSSCSYTVTVEDQQGPTVVCHDIIVDLGNASSATVCADSLYFDVNDNCVGPISISVKKPTSTTWSSCASFDCSELGNGNILQFRACDQYGNCTICEFEVEVQDKAAPVIDCGPPGVTVLSCNAFPGFNPGSYAPTVSDNCGSTVISWTIQNQMNCNFEGDYIVTYTATDIAGNTASCSKTFQFPNTNPLDASDIVWPVDIPDAGCFPDVADDNVTGEVTLLGTFCNPIYVSSALIDTTIDLSGCAVIHKAYTVVDSCVFGLSGGVSGKYTHTQLITVGGITAPILTVPADITTEPTDSATCTAYVTLADATATGCGDIAITNNYNNGGANASGIYPLGTTTVVFTATNECGIQSQDSMTVTVEYNTSNILTCPAPYTIPCEIGFNPDDIPLPMVQNVCGSYTLHRQILGDLNSCDASVLTITYTINTNDGRTDACSFLVTLLGKNPILVSDIDWPESYLIAECSQSNNPDSLNSFPIVTAPGTCVKYSIQYTDESATPILPTAVGAIDRTWTIVDSCFFDSGSGSGIFTFSQHIDLIDTTGPILLGYTNGDTIVVPIYTNSCSQYVDLSDAVAYDCSGVLKQSYSINGGQYYEPIDASGFYDLGVSHINYELVDSLGYYSYYDLYVQVVDSFPPTWNCPDSLDFYINASGLDTVYASMFSYAPFLAQDNCDNHVIMTFDSLNLADSVLYLACTGNVSDLSIQNLKIWVFDDSGLSTSCVVDLNVLEPAGQTTNCNHMMGIFGQLVSGDGDVISGATINTDGTVSFSQQSNAEGRYRINDIPPGSNIDVSVQKEESAINGVNVSDVIAIRDHILGKKIFNSPYKILAADVNNDDYLSVRDLLEIRKLILGYTDHYSTDKSWRFADRSYKFLSNEYPFNQPEVWFRHVKDLKGVIPQINWVGLKMGDVNNSHNVHGDDQLEARYHGSIPVFATVESENEYEVKIKLSCGEIQTLRGFQFEFDYDQTNLDLVDMRMGDIDGLDEDNVRSDKKHGSITFSWDDVEGRNGSEIATLVFHKVDKGESVEYMKLNEKRIDAMCQDLNGHEKKIELISSGKWSGNGLSTGQLLQNTPNPFTASTKITVMLSRAVEGVFTVYDITGKVVYRKKGSFEKGINTIELKAEDLQSSGIYLYKFESEIFTETKKMILVK